METEAVCSLRYHTGRHPEIHCLRIKSKQFLHIPLRRLFHVCGRHRRVAAKGACLFLGRRSGLGRSVPSWRRFYPRECNRVWFDEQESLALPIVICSLELTAWNVSQPEIQSESYTVLTPFSL
jgi:hypothetical protein